MTEFAKIKPFEFNDIATGNHISIKVTEVYSIIRINKRDYFFERETGEFDGTGMDLSEEPSETTTEKAA